MTIRSALLPASLLGLMALLGAPLGQAAEPKSKLVLDQESEARMRKDLFFLASPECEGRGPTTEGLKRAADHLAAQFKQIGLKPGFKGSYFQPFAIPGATGKLTLVGPRGQSVELKERAHFLPLGSDQKGKLDAPVVFAGYGVKTKDPAYDDYAGLNVKGKIVVLLRDAPRQAAADRPRAFANAAAFQAKLREAMQQGAAGVLIVNDAPSTEAGDALSDLSYSSLMRGGKRPPAMVVRRSVLEAMLPAGTTLETIERGIDRDLKPNSFDLPGWTVRMEVERNNDQVPLKNVIGVLEGNGPLANETVVVGAHYDHLGFGSSSSRAGTKVRAIHHGADDNASGTTGMVELARRFAAMPNRQGRRLVFMAFSGEELGLLGSRHYCNNPVFPLEQTVAMFNLDMIGRTQKDRKTNKPRMLTEGHGTARPFKELIENLAKKYDFTLSSKESGFGPSDHASFTGKKVPVLFFWTGTHPDYHMPSDTADKIDLKGMRTIVDMGQEVVSTFITMQKPTFIEVKGGPGGVRPSQGPRLGVQPNYDSADGVEVEEVVGGGIAQRGGIKKGDKILKIAGQETKNLRQYMQAMAQQKTGTTIEIVVIRDKKEVKLKVKLD